MSRPTRVGEQGAGENERNAEQRFAATAEEATIKARPVAITAIAAIAITFCYQRLA